MGKVPISFEVGERVWLDAKNIKQKTKSTKMNDHHLGPFTIVEKISKRAYHLELPESLKIHDIFYIGLLSKVKEDPTRPSKEKPPPIIIEGEEEYEVKAILDSK
ncbi:hypothetical protein RSAG8_02824, partial [Rhizoctonia solani AG-8 WAC10335]